MAAWVIAIEITGIELDTDILRRLVDLLERDFPGLAASCAVHSSELAVTVTVKARPPAEALRAALSAIDSVFDTAGIDRDRIAEISSVKMDSVPLG